MDARQLCERLERYIKEDAWLGSVDVSVEDVQSVIDYIKVKEKVTVVDNGSR